LYSSLCFHAWLMNTAYRRGGSIGKTGSNPYRREGGPRGKTGCKKLIFLR
jgi:hypothetical protein